MLPLDELLLPIPGPRPAGIDLRYDAIYDQIKDARREDDEGPLWDWSHSRKMADFGRVAQLAGDALAKRSKDLQLATWLTEAMLRQEGFAGLRAGLGVLHALLSRFWDDLYPMLEDGDPELRAAPLAWLGARLGTAVGAVPLNQAGHSLLKYKESRAIGYEYAASADPAQLAARELAIQEGGLSPEEFDVAVESTPKNWFKNVSANVDGSLEALAALDQLARDKFRDVAPDFRPLRESLVEVQQVLRQVVVRKLQIEPDPSDVASEQARLEHGNGEHSVVGLMLPQIDSVPNTTLGIEAGDREGSIAQVIVAAQFLRNTEPHNPASYLLIRGLRWGELRAQGAPPDPRLLEAPSTQVRIHLKALLLERRWAQLLEAAERTMGTAAGRGWLDLQRYSLMACAGLGHEFDVVANAIRAELRALLTDVPALMTMTLMDDMPAASPDTQRWFHEENVMNCGRGGSAADDGTRGLNMEANGAGSQADEPREHAMLELRAGRPERAIALLMEELGREKSPRARFFRRTEMARVMVDAGLEAIAVPILQELLRLIDTHKLAEWEPGELVAEPMTLLYRCLQKLPQDAVSSGYTQGTLYSRICSLDPLRALALKRMTT